MKTNIASLKLVEQRVIRVMPACLVTWVALIASTLLSSQTRANYAVFERHTDTIQVSGQTVLDRTATYEAVFLLRSSHSHGGNIFNELTSGQEDKSLMVSPNHVEADNYESTVPYPGLIVLRAKVAVLPDIWHHVAMVTDTQEDRLYLDGKLVAAQPRYAPIQNGAGMGFVGAAYRSGGGSAALRGFVGVLDSFRISNIARYAGLSFSPPVGDLQSDTNTLLLYNFNDAPTSLTVADESPQHRTGTLGAGFSGATSPRIVQRIDDLPTTPSQDIQIDPRATYLRTQADRAYNTIPISLASLGIQPGDAIFLEKIGDANSIGDYETSGDRETMGIAGLFSASAELGPPIDQFRVRGAIKTGQDFVTPSSQSGGLPTDIPEDFLIPDTGVVVVVPANALYLFAAAVDTKYQDNFDWDANFGIHLSRVAVDAEKTVEGLLLNWDAGILQSKTNVNATWADVPAAASPFLVAPDKPFELFRLRLP